MDLWAGTILAFFALQNLVFLLKRNTVEGIMFIFPSKLYFLTESPTTRISYLFFFSLWKKIYNQHFVYNISCNEYRMIDALRSKETLALPQHLWLDCYLITIPCHTNFLLISNHCITCWKLFIDTFIFRYLISKLLRVSFFAQHVTLLKWCTWHYICIYKQISLSLYV